MGSYMENLRSLEMDSLRFVMWTIFGILGGAVGDRHTKDNVTINNSYDELNKDDQKILAQLSLEKLLQVKHSIEEFNDVNETVPVDAVEIDGTEALALSADDDDPIRRADKLHKTKGGGKINKFFALSVTSLAFLAFGGYLLCLIVQAIKSKSYPYDPSMAATSQPVMVVAGTVKKKKPQFNYGRRKRELWEEPYADDMYDMLIKLAEGYADWDGVR